MNQRFQIARHIVGIQKKGNIHHVVDVATMLSAPKTTYFIKNIAVVIDTGMTFPRPADEYQEHVPSPFRTPREISNAIKKMKIIFTS